MPLLSIDSCQYLTVDSLEKLIGNGTKTVADFLSSNLETLSGRTGIPYKDLINTYHHLRKTFAPSPENGLELFKKHSTSFAIFSTGYSPLDEILEGGISTGEVTEIFGVSSSGKSYFCHNLAANVTHDTCYKIMYVDATNGFSAQRIKQSLKSKVDRGHDSFLSRIMSLKVYSLMDLLRVLKEFSDELQSGKASELREVRLLIIDSISAVATSFLCSGRVVEAHGLLTHLAFLMKELAYHRRMAVVVINDVILGDSGSLKAALGRFWSHVPSLSLHIQLLSNVMCNTNSRSVTVVKSTRVPIGQRCDITIL